jgi:hypothetical protein
VGASGRGSAEARVSSEPATVAACSVPAVSRVALWKAAPRAMVSRVWVGPRLTSLFCLYICSFVFIFLRRWFSSDPRSPSPAGFQRGLGEAFGVTGLRNLGNTCYMNTALQCLARYPCLVEYFLSGRYKDHINTENCLGYQVFHLFLLP